MPVKANVGVTRKVADNNYGSRGASVNLEVELDSSLVQEPERLQERIRQVFRLAQQSVEEELARQGTMNGHDTGPATTTNGNGHANGQQHNGNGHHHGDGQRRPAGRKATASQIRAIHAIINRQGLDLLETLRGRYGVDYAEELTITEASQLIDALKTSANGVGGGR